MPPVEWPKLLRECLSSTDFLALATTGLDGLWNNAVYFAWDERLSLYFMSMPASRHMQNIAANGEASVAIFSTAQSPQARAVGMQLRGTARILPDSAVPAAHRVYFDRAPIINGIPHKLEEFLGASAAWKLVQITPQEIGYFNSEIFGENREVVPSGVTL